MKKLEITRVLDKIPGGYKPPVKHELMLGNRHSNAGYHGIYYRKSRDRYYVEIIANQVSYYIRSCNTLE